MLALHFLPVILLLTPTISLCAQQVAFAAHHDLQFALDPEQPLPPSIEEARGIQFRPSDSYPLPPTSAILISRPTTLYRPRSLEVLHRVRLRSLQHAESEAEQVVWDKVEVEGPDVSNLHTLSQLARMSGNAYALPGQQSWYEVDHAWNVSFPFGWEESDGFRGHVFQSSDNSTIVLSIKGTTLNGPTSKLDKFNDNLLFSCCCARVDVSWVFRTVCDCYSKNWRCDSQCLTDALIQDSLFYSIGVKLIDDLLKIYPRSNIWLVGHSLGGSLASLLGATYGLPAVAFEAPGERLAASRLHLPLPPPVNLPTKVQLTRLPPATRIQRVSPVPEVTHMLQGRYLGLSHLGWPFPPSKPTDLPIPEPTPPSPYPSPTPSHHLVATTHVYHTADPIPQGTCNGFGSPCAQAGYALETRCHLGQSIVFDSVTKLGWSVDIRKHPIKEMVYNVLEADVWWGEDDKEGGVPDEGEGGEGVQRRSLIGSLKSVLGWLCRWKGKKGKGKHPDGQREVPLPIIEEDCVDCFKWEFGDFKDKAR